ncbi:biopolymer transporter ExbD [Mucilaginibacter ginsenosidivorans]|uniref:Biopolymer transporter ExbD n=1 Tax=Mucilaginibacter ginsenosidivorans TaxID=398053 RepID=A0A5B8URB4_9SPHI|nr:biopolymer transporter ExbD [Mucilaginibacter ginsenosidivorans]QEC61432.1 hypothetical protein FRZ54_02145 [Mucilaginibacter ginsenosidivorans]
MRRPSKHLDHLALTMRIAIDVGFIVVIFLMVTGKLRRPTPFVQIRNIQLPYSTLTSISDLDGELAIIYFVKGRVMLQLPDTIKTQTLVAMGEKYHVAFSDTEINKFKKMDLIEVPLGTLKQFINEYDSGSFDNKLMGIRFDSPNNELGDWITESNKVSKNTTGDKLHFYLYGDRSEQYSVVRKIFNVLQDRGVNKWSLLTWTKSRQ